MLSKSEITKITYKAVFAVLGLSSVLLEIVVLLDRGVFNPGNFFSFFTILSNIFAAVMLLASAAFVYRGKASRKLDFFRGAAALYMTLTGVVFAVLLSSIDPRLLTAVPWDNTVLHYIMPVVLLVDWLVDKPSRPVKLRYAAWWLVVPVAYVAYSLIRGPIVGWYPYPFLNPQNGGYGAIFATCVGITAFTVVATFLLLKLQRPNGAK